MSGCIICFASFAGSTAIIHSLWENTVNPRCFAGLIALIAALAVAPAFAQDESSLSDEGLRQKLDRVSSHRYSNAQRRGYRNRVTASDYELEFQMQQIDKRMAEDDHARANLITQEMGRRNAAREQAKRAHAAAEREARSRESHETIMGLIEQQRAQMERSRAQMEQQRRQTDAQMQALAEQRERDMQQVEDFWQREREETRQNSTLPTLPTLTDRQ